MMVRRLGMLVAWMKGPGVRPQPKIGAPLHWKFEIFWMNAMDDTTDGYRAMTDGQLLARFREGSDGTAFGELVSRHGPGILRRCRRVLDNTPDAEDVFQATFQVLLRRAFSLREPELVGGWLHGVARRIAVRLRLRAVRQDRLERSHGERSWTALPPEDSLGEVGRIIRDAVGRLPASYREAVTLVYLEGATHQEAASRLGWPLGTLKVRLVRARRLLRDRLAGEAI
jgi:RNA polymerase sigma factor (sigma-70 family)